MKSDFETLKVVDLKEEGELSESKFENPNAIDKHELLENFTRGTQIQSEEIGPSCDGNAVSCTPPDAGLDCATKRESGFDEVPQCSLASHEHDPQFISNSLQPGSLETSASGHGIASPEKIQLNCSKFPSDDECVDVSKDADGSMIDSSPPVSFKIVDASADYPSSDQCLGDWDVGNKNTAVSICPDCILYHEKHCTESVLNFSSSSITMKGSTDQEIFSFQWELDDIVNIESLWFERLETAMVKIRTASKDGCQGIEEMKFAVVDSNWCEKQEEIMSLDVRYSTLWNVMFDADIGRNGATLVGQGGGCLSKRYFPNFEESFEEVVFPKGDSDAVSISKRDVDLLQPDTFVNDTIIDFYIKYLKNKIQPEERHRFHFFNSFFFRKLADLDKDPSSACQGRAAFQRVRKWTRKVDLFEKDYVFIPVNFNYHWSLIIICHPGEVAKLQGEHMEKSFKVPCILHMDSIRGSHTGLKDLVQSYLWEEWKEKQRETSEDISSEFSNLRFVHLDLPQQQNSYDCGLFLLHYVELFLEEAPLNFSPFKITKFSNFLNGDWFPPAEASLKRVLIQRLIHELLDNHSPATNGEEHFPADCPKSINGNETGIEFFSDGGTPKTHKENLFSQAGHQNELSLLPTLSQQSSQCASDSGLVLREFFEPGVPEGSFIDRQYQAFDRMSSFNEFKSALSAMEVDIEAGGHSGYPSASDTGFPLSAPVTSEACALAYSSRDFKAEATWNQEITGRQTEYNDPDLSPETSLSDPHESLNVQTKHKIPVVRDLGVPEKLDLEKLPLENREVSTESLTTASELLDVSVSQDPNHVLNGNGEQDPPKPLPIVLAGLNDQEYDMRGNGNDVCHDSQLICNGAEAEVRAAKRPKQN